MTVWQPGGVEAPPDPAWEPTAPGHWRRDYRITEWVGAPVTTCFADWTLARIEMGMVWAARRRFGPVRLRGPLHIVINGWLYCNDGDWEGLRATALRHPLYYARWFRAMASLAEHPERMRSVMAAPSLRWLDDELLPHYRVEVAAASARLAGASAQDLVSIVDGLAEQAGRLVIPAFELAGCASKAELAVVSFGRRELPGVDGLLDLIGFERPALAAAVASLDTGAPSPAQVLPAASRPGTGLDHALDRLGGRRGRARLTTLVSLAAELGVQRERILGEFVAAWPVMTRALGRLGEHLTTSGVLDDPVQVHDLRRDEIIRALTDPVDLRDVADRRRQQRADEVSFAAPLTIGEPVGAFQKRAGALDLLRGTQTERGDLLGTPIAGGLATGAVLVVSDPGETVETADTVDTVDGRVVVVPILTPGWVPAVAGAAAIVVDGGAQFAHASLIARELGVPVVAATGCATSRLRTGDVVTVDGDRGAVRIDRPVSSR